jgi:hypothetical protein
VCLFWFKETGGLHSGRRSRVPTNSFEIMYKRLEIVCFREGVATIMSTGYSFKSSFKDCRREICLNCVRMLATLAPASTTKLKKKRYWLLGTGNVSEH